VIARLRTAFGIELPLRTLFEAPTVENIATAIVEAPRVDGANRAPRIQRLERRPLKPLDVGTAETSVASVIMPRKSIPAEIKR
jgi:hypothetical protein